MKRRSLASLPPTSLAVTLAALLAACGGGASSEAPASAANRAPVAVAGPEQLVHTGQVVRLDARASSDPDGDPLTYAWTLSARPAGSTAELVDAAGAAPRFVADQPGVYVAALTVHDGRHPSAAAQVTVRAATGPVAPVADAGPVQQVVTGAQVTLSGAASSDADGDALSHRWTLAVRPPGSTAQLSGADTVAPRFVADVAGRYEARLVVHDGTLESAPATAVVDASAARLAASVMPESADFGSVPVGGSASRVLTLRNTGNGLLGFRQGYPAAVDGGVWAMGARSCTGTLAPGASCTVTVVFTPGNAQAYRGAVEIGFRELPTGQGGPLVALAGQGSGATASVAVVTPAAADFGSVPLGHTASRVFTVRNTGTERLAFRAGSPGTDGAPWSVGARSCAAGLDPGASCQVTVNFMPLSARSYIGTAYFHFDGLQDGQGNPLAGLTGQGEGTLALAATLTPEEADFGTVPVGTTAERVLTLVNTGNGPLRLRPGSPGAEGGPWTVRGGSCTGELPPGSRCTLTVAFTPLSVQPYTGSAFVHFAELPLEQGSVRAVLRGQGG